MWADRPILGVGLGSYDYAYSDYREKHIHILGDYSILQEVNDYAGAAHNEVLQVLAETGLVGLALGVLLLWLCLRRARWRHETVSLFAVAATGMIGFPLENPATAAVAALCLGISSR